jgi:hypothetical protein
MPGCKLNDFPPAVKYQIVYILGRNTLCRPKIAGNQPSGRNTERNPGTKVLKPKFTIQPAERAT